jgi:hypothetical protein
MPLPRHCPEPVQKTTKNSQAASAATFYLAVIDDGINFQHGMLLMRRGRH